MEGHDERKQASKQGVRGREVIHRVSTLDMIECNSNLMLMKDKEQ